MRAARCVRKGKVGLWSGSTTRAKEGAREGELEIRLVGKCSRENCTLLNARRYGCFSAVAAVAGRSFVEMSEFCSRE